MTLNAELAAFGISADTVRSAHEAIKARFLEKQGWSETVLADYGLTIHPPSDCGDGLRNWHIKYKESLHGHSYVNIAYCGIDNEALWCQPPRVGVAIPFRRVRLLDYQKKDGKYRQYAGTGNRLFIPQDASRPDYWVDIAKNIAEPIMITEGEFDAISAHSRGYPCIGVSGIDCFRDKKTGKIAEPGEDIIWDGREVVLLPDQDEESTLDAPIKATVLQGLERLATILAARGAKVKVTRIALTTLGRRNIGRKVGLSEFFALGGNGDELWSSAVPISEMDMRLATMLRSYSMYEGAVVDNDTGRMFKMNDFKNMQANVFVRIDDKPRLVADLWLRSPLRQDITEFVSRDDEPYGPISGTTFFNTWRGWPIEPCTLEGDEAQQTIDYFEEWSQRMWGEEWPWVRGLVAHLLQQPNVLRPHALVLCTPLKGIGKSTWFRLLGHLVGEELYCSVEQSRLFARFNDFMQGKMIVHVDEANVFSHAAVRQLMDRITNPVINVESKGLRQHDEPWRGLLCLTGNESFIIKTSAQERRLMQSAPNVEEDEVDEWRGILSEVIVPWLFAEDGGETIQADLERRMGYIMAHLLKPEWLDDYDIWQPAPKTESFLDSVDAAKSERTVLAENLYALLPDVFIFPPGYTPRGQDTNGRLDRYIVAECCAAAKLKGSARIEVGGQYRTVSVYGKHRDSYRWNLKQRRKWVSTENVEVRTGRDTSEKVETLNSWLQRCLADTRDAISRHILDDPWK